MTRKNETTLYIVPSKENFLERYCDKYTNKIVHCYEKEWDAFVSCCKDFIKGKFTNDLRCLLVERISPVPEDLPMRFNGYEKEEYCQYLFRESVCMDESYKKVGKTIEIDLPVAFKIYIKKERYVRLAKGGLPKNFCIKDFNSMRELCVKSIRKKLKAIGFDCRPIDEGVVNNFEFFTINLIQTRKYNASEDMLIRGKRDPDMPMISNYRPNKFFFGKNKKSIFAVENNNKEQSQEVIGAVFCTLGVALLTTLVGGIGISYKDHKDLVDKMKEASKYFTADEVDKIDNFINNLCRDIDFIEEHFENYAMNKKYENYVSLYINDNIRDTSIAKMKMDLKKNNIGKNNILKIQLFFRIDVDDSINEVDDGTYIAEKTDNLNGILKKARDFISNKLEKEKLTKSKSKIIKVEEDGERSPSNLSTQIDILMSVEPPKEIIEILDSVQSRIPKE